jgi:DNA-binding NarL/FixJ family response regulator
VAVRVVVAEDNALLRRGLSLIIGSDDRLELVGACGDAAELTALCDAERPDVVVTDIRMPPGHTDEGIRAAAWLRTEHPGTGVVVLSQHANPEYALGLLHDGYAGRAYLLKERVSDEGQLVGAILAVAEGGSVIDPAVVEALVSATTRKRAGELDRLTPREREILAEVATGKSNAAIAAALIVSERAVEKHCHAIFTKLGLTEEPAVNRRVAAVLAYLSAT